MAKESTNGTNATNDAPKESTERAEPLRIMNLKAVAARLDLSEQRVRNLVHDDHLTTEERVLEGTDLSFTIIPESAIDAYLKAVQDGDIVSKKARSNLVAFTVYLPKDVVPDVTAQWESAGYSFTERKRRSASGDNAESTEGESTESAASTASAATLEANRQAELAASIPQA
jgi:apolipoprotein N-acyltransferase